MVSQSTAVWIIAVGSAWCLLVGLYEAALFGGLAAFLFGIVPDEVRCLFCEKWVWPWQRRGKWNTLSDGWRVFHRKCRDRARREAYL